MEASLGYTVRLHEKRRETERRERKEERDGGRKEGEDKSLWPTWQKPLRVENHLISFHPFIRVSLGEQIVQKVHVSMAT